MVFSSLIFLFLFLPVVLIVYYIVPNKLKNSVLLFFSLVFYAWGEPIYIILMLTTIILSYIGGVLIAWMKRKEKPKLAKGILIIFSILSLSTLAFFKYANFAIGTVNGVFGTNAPLLNIALPIGISFYTFQTLSYMIDVYRSEKAVQKNPISYGTYVAMFPQLIAGPIVQYKTIDEQLRSRKHTSIQFENGIHHFMIGLGKKVLLANNIGLLWSTIQAMTISEVPAVTAWLGIIAFTLQIYFDFSAYSDMAIGLGHMFGFSFLENFDYPYESKSITEFWRRWHISLGKWFRDYVYIPLGGNRVPWWRHIINILIVWLLTGFWHGASWNFVVWGLYYAILLILEKFVFGKYLKKLPALLQHFYCLLLVALGWVLFAFENIGDGFSFISAMFGGGQGFANKETLYLLYNNAILLVVCLIGCTSLPKRIGNWVASKLKGKQIVLTIIQNVVYVCVFILSVAYLVDASFNPFLYFRF